VAKTVFITGASSGIGRALAAEFARRGCDLFLTARRLDALEQVRAEIARSDSKRRVEVRRLDVTDVPDVALAISEAAEAFGRIDVVVANAGLGSSGPVGEGRMARERQVIETNVIGAMATIDAAVAQFRLQGGGQVVGIGSVAGARGLPTSGSYSASKAAIATYLDAVRVETHREPITVTTIAPGYIDTPINQDMKSRPFLISVEEGARITADLIERGVGYATVPRFPWTVAVRLLRVLPTSLLARAMPEREFAAPAPRETSDTDPA
jgi:short-subunit dehydrogenase